MFFLTSVRPVSLRHLLDYVKLQRACVKTKGWRFAVINLQKFYNRMRTSATWLRERERERVRAVGLMERIFNET